MRQRKSLRDVDVGRLAWIGAMEAEEVSQAKFMRCETRREQASLRNGTRPLQREAAHHVACIVPSLRAPPMRWRLGPRMTAVNIPGASAKTKHRVIIARWLLLGYCAMFMGNGRRHGAS